MGFRRATELIITGRVIDAAEAKEVGLINEVVPSGNALSRALELAREIAGLPQPAIRTDNEAATRGFGRPLDEGMRIEAECFDRLIGDPGWRRACAVLSNVATRSGNPAIRPGIDRPRSPDGNLEENVESGRSFSCKE